MAPVSVSEIVTGSQSVSHLSGNNTSILFGCLWLPSLLWDWEWKGRKLGTKQKKIFLTKKSCPSFEGLVILAGNCVTGCTNPCRIEAAVMHSNTYSVNKPMMPSHPSFAQSDRTLRGGDRERGEKIFMKGWMEVGTGGERREKSVEGREEMSLRTYLIAKNTMR